jgi:cytochrome P450
MILLTAGHETTAAIISNGTLAVLSQPDRRPQFLQTPARAIEELLRLAGRRRKMRGLIQWSRAVRK